jgi:hypothetical protein
MSQIGKLQTWKIPADKLYYWQRLNPDIPKDEATDCVINSLHYLGVIENPDFAKFLSNYTNTNQRGTSDSEVLKLIFEKFNKDDHYKIINHKVGSKTDLEIRKELKDGDYTFAFYRRSTGMWHGVIVTKQNNVMYVLDPQQQIILCESTNYVDWVNEQKFVHIDYILKNKITRKRNETRVKLRKKTLSEHTRKRRRIGKSNSSSSTTKKENMLENVIEKILPKKKTSSTNSSTSTLSSTPKKKTGTKKNLNSISTSTSTLTSSPKKRSTSKNSSLSSTKKANVNKQIVQKKEGGHNLHTDQK